MSSVAIFGMKSKSKCSIDFRFKLSVKFAICVSTSRVVAGEAILGEIEEIHSKLSIQLIGLESSPIADEKGN
jgi:hypothetical protein